MSGFVGGLGLSLMDECIIGIELASGCTGISTALNGSSLAVCLREREREREGGGGREREGEKGEG